MAVISFLRSKLGLLSGFFVLISGCSAAEQPAKDSVWAIPDANAPGVRSGALLSFDSARSIASNQKALPSPWKGPDQTVCSPDVTRGFMSELTVHSVDDSKVRFEWAPIVSGSDKQWPNLAQPEMELAGVIDRVDPSTDDILFAHPFGLDLGINVKADSEYQSLVSNRPGSSDGNSIIHTEIEQGLIPHVDFGYSPLKGDRILMRGAWIFDCGHPPYEAEIHPPTFMAFARATSPAVTESFAFSNPYRVAQLYNADHTLTTLFENQERFYLPTTTPFVPFFLSQLLLAALDSVERLKAHHLVEATRLSEVVWFVCAPETRPANAVLDVESRFTMRTGVSVQVAYAGDSGCVEVRATTDKTYKPFKPERKERVWSWAELSKSASGQLSQSIDVRKTIVDVMKQRGFSQEIKALREDNPPIVDWYDSLKPRNDAKVRTPSALIKNADDQPFPFYGHVKVAWKVKGT